MGTPKQSKALLKTSLRYSLTWKSWIKSTKHICRKVEITEKNHIETSENLYHTETSKLIYIANQFTGSCVNRVFDTSYLSVFSPDAGKYGSKITPYLDTFHAVYFDSTITLSQKLTLIRLLTNKLLVKIYVMPTKVK